MSDTLEHPCETEIMPATGLQEFVEHAAGPTIKYGNPCLRSVAETAKRAEILAQHTEAGMTAPPWMFKPMSIRWSKRIDDALDAISTPEGRRIRREYRRIRASIRFVGRY